jgi:hypothetical protein
VRHFVVAHARMELQRADSGRNPTSKQDSVGLSPKAGDKKFVRRRSLWGLGSLVQPGGGWRK